MNFKAFFQNDPIEAYEQRYPKVLGSLDGFQIGSQISNTSSIAASFNDYTTLSGIRSVPLSDFHSAPRQLFYAADDLERVKQLAELLKQSRRIDPLIVAVDSDGPWILEGGHRLGALHILQVQHFPALVVISNDD